MADTKHSQDTLGCLFWILLAVFALWQIDEIGKLARRVDALEAKQAAGQPAAKN